MPINFDNTEIAFSSQSVSDLKRAYWLFRFVASPLLVSIGKIMTSVALALKIPIGWLIKPTIFRHFCGGETLEESRKVINSLARDNIKSVPDYSAEAKQTEDDFDFCMEQTLSIIREAEKNKNIGFAVFKPTGIARFALLEKVSGEIIRNKLQVSSRAFREYSSVLTQLEKNEYDRVHDRFLKICTLAKQSGVPVFIDAEESWIQDAIDALANEMMALCNREKPVVFNTFQLYRKNRLEYLIECYFKAKKENYFLGAKLVRGAYMEKERASAAKQGVPSPIHDTKVFTDCTYDGAIRFCLRHYDRIACCIATHNEKSTLLAVQMIEQQNIPNNHPHIHFSQLYGMSDHISYNLAKQGCNVSKYVPFGPVREVLPYLIRRAEENTAVRGQTGRELSNIRKEIRRRKNLLS